MSDPVPTTGDRRPALPLVSATAASVARRAVRESLRKTAKLVAACARRPTLDAEDIHRLRVSTRRADAALITFRPFLPAKKRRRLRRRLRRIRRRAGKLRDVDVLLERLANPASTRAEFLSESIRHLRNRRRALARKLRTAARRELDDHFQRRTTHIIKQTRWREVSDEPPFSQVARSLLRPVADRLRQQDGGDLSDLRRLHRFRVAVKRLRYTLDFVATGALADDCAALRAQLSELQSQLGRICDHAAAMRLLTAERAAACVEDSQQLDALIRQEHALLSEQHAAFVTAWPSHGRRHLHQALDACLECS